MKFKREGVFFILKKMGLLKSLNLLKNRFGWTTVLCFHRINNDHNPFFPSLSEQKFETIIQYASENFEIISLNRIHEPAKMKPTLILTFDDGYKDFILNAVPILKKYKVPCTHCIVTDSVEKNQIIWTQRFFNLFRSVLTIDKKEITVCLNGKQTPLQVNQKELLRFSKRLFGELLVTPIIKREKLLTELSNSIGVDPVEEEMMTWTDIQKCIEAGVEIGSHTVSHDSLISIQDQKALEFEILQSKSILEKKLNIEVKTISFPNGLYNENILNISRQGGYKNLLILDDNLHYQSKGDTISRLPIYHNGEIENLFKMESFHNLVKSPYRKVKENLGKK